MHHGFNSWSRIIISFDAGIDTHPCFKRMRQHINTSICCDMCWHALHNRRVNSRCQWDHSWVDWQCFLMGCIIWHNCPKRRFWSSTSSGRNTIERHWRLSCLQNADEFFGLAIITLRHRNHLSRINHWAAANGKYRIALSRNWLAQSFFNHLKRRIWRNTVIDFIADIFCL